MKDNPIKDLIQNVQRHILPNGLTILAREDHSVPIVTTMIWYRVGSRCEKAGSTGISHLLEHMMFKGTRRFAKGEIDYITARNGGTSNAFTSKDYSAYFFSFASDRWRQALEIEASRMRDCLLDPEEFNLEKEVVLEELKMDLDTPWEALRKEVELCSFERHPYRYPVIGNYEDVERLSVDQLRRYYQQFYCPANAILVLVGDFETDEALRRIEDLFGPLTDQARPQPWVEPEEFRPGLKRVEVRKPSNVTRLLIALPSPPVSRSEHHCVDLLDNTLAEGKLGRLYQRLVEKERLVSVVTTEFNQTLDPYLFYIRAELQENADPVRVERVIFEEIENLRQTRLGKEELERARNQSLIQFLEDFETSLGQALQLGMMETLEHFEYWSLYAERLLALSAEDVRAAAEQLWTPEYATVGILLNGSDQQISLPAQVPA
ncbi:MAG: insulinase family protein [Acidobacteria bacterium]|nr:insulinase family protein [Acidobacteriota bacterium]